MREFQEKRKLRKVILSWPAIFVLAAMTLWLLASAAEEYMRMIYVRRARMAVEAELNDTKEKTAALEKSLDGMESESGLDKIIRERFNVKKPGENVIVIVNKDKGVEPDESFTVDSFLSSVWAAIKDIF